LKGEYSIRSAMRIWHLLEKVKKLPLEKDEGGKRGKGNR